MTCQNQSKVFMVFWLHGGVKEALQDEKKSLEDHSQSGKYFLSFCRSRLPLGVICLFIVMWLKNIFALVEFVIMSEDSIWVYSTCISILKPNSSVS